MTIIEVSSMIAAGVAVLWVGVAVVKVNNKRFHRIEEDIDAGELRHMECSMHVKGELKAFQEKLDFLVEWAKNGGGRG